MSLKNKLFLFFKKDELILQTTVVFAGTALGGFFNLLYHLVSVRLLTPQDYGSFNALISFLMFISITITPFTPTLTRFFTEYITKKDFSTLSSIFTKLITRLFIVAFLVFLLFFVISSPLARFLKTQTIYIIICGGIIMLSLFSLPVSPLFQSFQKFKTYSFIGILSSFGKLLFGTFLMFIGWGVLGGLLGFLAAPVLLLLVALFFIPNVFKKEMGYIHNKTSVTVSLVPIYKYFFPVSIVMLSFTVFTNIDIILVKRFFSPLDAGYYSIAQMVGKIALFFPSALAIVIFPKTTKVHVENNLSRSFLYKSLFIAATTGAIFTVVCFFFPEFILKVLTGQENPISTSLVGLFVLTMSIYALTWIALHFLLASHNTRIVMPFIVIALLQAILIYFYHSTLRSILGIVFAFSLVSFFVSLGVVKAGKA